MVRGLKFWKMHGLGNDYVVVNNMDGNIDTKIMADLAKTLCQRRFSVGADGLIFACKSEDADVKMRIFNQDGSEAEMCGNGIRCLAKFCYENGIARKSELTIETLAGIKKVWMTMDKTGTNVKTVKVDMGEPSFERKSLPMLGEGNFINQELKIDGKTYKATCLSVGNPHCVIFTKNVNEIHLEDIGPKIERHKLFPNRINVEFAQLINSKEVKARVWERGVGETMACGTGACAIAVVGNVLGMTGKKVKVHLLGGDLEVYYYGRILMEGPAVKVFAGELF